MTDRDATASILAALAVSVTSDTPRQQTVTITEEDGFKYLHDPTKYAIVQVAKDRFIVAYFEGGNNLATSNLGFKIYGRSKVGEGTETFPILNLKPRTKPLSEDDALHAAALLSAGHLLPRRFELGRIIRRK